MCSNPSKTTTSSNGACYNSNWNIYGNVGLNGAYSDSLTVYCSQLDCVSASFYGSNLLDATVDCDDESSCSSATINFGEVNSLDLRCTNTSACWTANVYCPYRNENACSIDCCENCGDINTCYGMKIYVPDGYTYGYLDISCPSAEIFPSSNGCVNLNVNCQDGQKSTVYYVYNSTIHDYECQYGGIAYCCPYYKGNSIVCNPGSDCSIDCAVMSNQDTSCANTFIDGTDSNVLNVNCFDSDCSGSLIHCPAGGCVINCKGYSSCNSAQIVYNGALSDYGRVSINCTDYYACQNLIIDAKYADQVDIDCNTMDYVQNYVCYSSTLNAQYAKTVNLAFRDEYCSWGSNWNVNYAQTVTLTAFGSYSFYSSSLHAENAGFLSVICSSDSGYVACMSNNWHVPYNTEFNCYGDGCYQLYRIYSYHSTPNDINGGLLINMYSCGQCTSFSDCIYDFNLYCNSGNNVDNFYGDDYSYYDGCNSDYCGCNTVVNNVEFSFSVTNGNCYSPLQAKTCTSVSGQDCVVNCDYDNGACTNSVIDGSGSTYLTVNCMYSDYCQNVLIQCPTDGCFINCNSTSVCSNAHILYQYSGNVFINCEGASSCSNMIIDAPYADTIDIYCKAVKNEYSSVCDQLTLNAQNAENVFLNFINEYASSSSTYNVENVRNLILSSYGTQSFYSSILHAEYAQSVQLNCGSQTADSSACSSSSYYLPYNAELNCFGDGCYQIGTIYLNTNATGLTITSTGCDKCQSLSECIYSFSLYCNINGYQQSSTCSGSSTSYSYYDYCQCYKVMNRSIYDDSNHDSRCYASLGSVDGLQCSDGEDCTVSCDYYGKCSDGFIDGSKYSYLTVKCQGENFCQNARILCPANGCNIECKSRSACYYAEIFYPYENYENGQVNVDCAGSDSCNNMKIIANSAYSVTLKCKSTENNYEYVCNYVSLNATNSNKVVIVGNHEYGIANSNIYVNNAISVELHARGAYGFWMSYLYAMNAKSVSIKCVSEYTAACSDSYWYLADNDTTFNCYGAGCNGLGSIFVNKSAENIKFNLNSCKECDDKESCLGSLVIYCKDSMFSETYYGYTYDTFNDNECYTPSVEYYDNTCGCNEFIKSVSYYEDSSDSNCYSASLSSGEIAAIVAGCVGGVVGCILICVLLYCYQKRSSKRAVAKYTPSNNINYTSAAVVVNPTPAPVPVTRYTPQQVVIRPTPMFITPQPPMSAVTSISAASDASYATTNDVQLVQVNAGPSAPSMETPIPGAASAPSAPSAPGNYEEAPPSYNSVQVAAPPPAYSDVASVKQYVPGEGEGRVTNM